MKFSAPLERKWKVSSVKKAMDMVVPQSSAERPESLELEQLIGARQAYSRVADSCSAADAELLLRIRDQKLYRLKGLNWDQFCMKHLSVSRAEADKIIRRFEEFGQAYFDVSRIVRISPESYRAIAPAVKDNTIEWNGEPIALVPENARQVNAAVQALRTAAQAKQPKPAPLPAPEKPVSLDPNYDRIRELELQVREATKELREICKSTRNSRDRQMIQSFAHFTMFNMRDLETLAA